MDKLKKPPCYYENADGGCPGVWSNERCRLRTCCFNCKEFNGNTGWVTFKWEKRTKKERYKKKRARERAKARKEGIA